MRILHLILIIFLNILTAHSFAGEISLTGNYYGKNLVVVNPSYGEGFCVTKVWVNGKPSHDEIMSNSFEIDFSLSGLKTGDEVRVVITHHDGCLPKVINPQALRADQFFEFTYIKFDRSAILNWKVKGDLGDDPFIIEQLRWNKWSCVGEIGVGDTLDNGTYSFEASFHTGINQFRILRIDAYENPVYSKVAKYNNVRGGVVDLESTKVTDKIIFTAETIYELFDEKGNYLTGGYGKEIDVNDLIKGKYFLSYDVKSATIIKK